MSNVLGTLFGDIAAAIREKTGGTDTMKPAEFPANIRAIESGGTEGVDQYYQRLAEAVLIRDAKYLDGDSTVLSMKGFVMSDGSTLANVCSYAFAGFRDVEVIALSDALIISENAFVGDTKLKIIDITVPGKDYPQCVAMENALNGCSALEAVIFRDGGIGINTAWVNSNNGANDTFFIYVPAAYYDTITAAIPAAGLPASRYRKLEDYPDIDNWDEA